VRQLVLLSGKGGTGKTSVTAAIAHLASAEASVVIADADVDGANLELVLDPRLVESHPFMGGQVAVIDPLRCSQCGVCEEVCRFSAVVSTTDEYRIDPSACEGCAACLYRCPDQAIQMAERQAGLWFRSETRFGPLLHARLFAGAENTGKLVTEIREQSRRVCLVIDHDLVIVDGPPGIGCPSIAASTGVDLALLVTEPTASGIHDLRRALAMLEYFRVPALVLINKADINPRQARAIAAFCQERAVDLVGEIPYDTAVTGAMVHGQPVTLDDPEGAVSAALHAVWEKVRDRLSSGASADIHR
jgi:MinD superfamily P-loop ATPase